VLRGDLRGFHGIRVNAQWRIVFRWVSGDALDVQVLDYHGEPSHGVTNAPAQPDPDASRRDPPR
jgi:hypothetical protein